MSGKIATIFAWTKHAIPLFAEGTSLWRSRLQYVHYERTLSWWVILCLSESAVIHIMWSSINCIKKLPAQLRFIFAMGYLPQMMVVILFLSFVILATSLLYIYFFAHTALNARLKFYIALPLSAGLVFFGSIAFPIDVELTKVGQFLIPESLRGFFLNSSEKIVPMVKVITTSAAALSSIFSTYTGLRVLRGVKKFGDAFRKSDYYERTKRVPDFQFPSVLSVLRRIITSVINTISTKNQKRVAPTPVVRHLAPVRRKKVQQKQRRKLTKESRRKNRRKKK